MVFPLCCFSQLLCFSASDFRSFCFSRACNPMELFPLGTASQKLRNSAQKLRNSACARAVVLQKQKIRDTASVFFLVLYMHFYGGVFTTLWEQPLFQSLHVGGPTKTEAAKNSLVETAYGKQHTFCRECVFHSFERYILFIYICNYRYIPYRRVCFSVIHSHKTIAFEQSKTRWNKN